MAWLIFRRRRVAEAARALDESLHEQQAEVDIVAGDLGAVARANNFTRRVDATLKGRRA